MKLRPLFCVLGAVSVGVLSARAQFVWTDLNGTDSFSDGLNWLPTVPPTNGSTLLFGVAGVPNVVLDENFSASTITFDTFAYDITHFSGTLTITNGIVYSALDTGTTFINVPISISSVISILNTSLTGALELEGVGGTGGFTLTGVGNTLLGGTNTYSGKTRVTSGTLADAAADAFSPNSLYQVVLGGHLIVNANENVSGLSDNGGAGGTVAVASGAVLMMTGTASTTFSGVISGLGGVEKDGLGTFTLTGANTYSGGTAITGASLSVGDGATVGARITGNVADAGTLTFAPALADGYTFAGTISGNGAVTFAGPGSITLSGPNAYLGMTSVNAGTLSDGAAGSFSPGSRMLVNSSGGSLAVNFNETVADLENGGTGGPVSIASGAVLTSLGSVYGGDFKGAVSGAGKFSVSAGVQGLSGNNAYTGGTLITGIGELFVGSNTALGTGTVTLSGTATDLSPDANVSLANAVVLNSTLDNTAGGTNNLTLTGPITGAAGITWSAPGTLTLTNTGNAFGGNVDMVNGSLVVGNTGATGTGTIVLNSSTTITVSGGATVGNALSFPGTAAVVSGNGTIATPVTVNAGVVLAPSASPGGGPGDLSFSSGLTLATNGTLHFDLFDATGTAGTGYSLISANGGLTVAAAASSITFDIFSTNARGAPANAINFIPTTSHSWTVATSSGLTGFTGNEFNIVTTGFRNGLSGGSFSISSTGNNLMLNFTPVPEPSTWAMLGAGVLAVVPFALRRKSSATA